MRRRGVAGEVDAQQGERVDDLEAGRREALGGVGEQGAGADVAQRVILGAERVDPPPDLVDGRHDALVGERELHDAAVERPRPDPDPWVRAPGAPDAVGPSRPTKVPPPPSVPVASARTRDTPGVEEAPARTR